jgi:hypothetical protein
MKKRATLAAVVATAAPATAAAKHRHFPPGCKTRACANRIGAIWSAHHPRAHAASFVAPYRAFLAKLRACEANKNPAKGPTGYQSNTGNGFYGAYQFTLSSWAAVGGTGRPDQAPPAEQDYRAVRLLKLQGPGAWPVCSQ